MCHYGCVYIALDMHVGSIYHEEGSNMVWRNVLSDREIEISGLVSHEFTNYQIGEKLNISETTVKTHLRNIYSKTGIHDRATLAIRILNSDKT